MMISAVTLVRACSTRLASSEQKIKVRQASHCRVTMFLAGELTINMAKWDSKQTLKRSQRKIKMHLTRACNQNR